MNLRYRGGKDRVTKDPSLLGCTLSSQHVLQVNLYSYDQCAIFCFRKGWVDGNSRSECLS